MIILTAADKKFVHFLNKKIEIESSLGYKTIVYDLGGLG